MEFFQGIDMMQASQKYSPSKFQLIEGLGVFRDDSESFQTFLKKSEAQRVAASHGMRMRTKHQIHPKVGSTWVYGTFTHHFISGSASLFRIHLKESQSSTPRSIMTYVGLRNSRGLPINSRH